MLSIILRCGRTDKGVSAYNQVVSIDLRTNLLDGVGVRDYDGCTANSRNIHDKENIEEIDFCKIINANLPPEIQIIGWAPCPSLDYSARFNCINRTYKYFFPRDPHEVRTHRIISISNKLYNGTPNTLIYFTPIPRKTSNIRQV